MPKISAVMALYNTPIEYLTKTVQSILNQTFNDFELIIIDDYSTYEFREFFESFNDERIKYFKFDKNSGPGHARNVGIKKAVGEYIAIVDSDDIYMPNRFELQVEFLDKNPEISLIGGAFKYSNNGKIPLILEKDDDIKTLMLFNSPLANPIVAFRKDIFVDKNLFYPEDTKFAEDYQLWINAMFCGIKMANLKELLMIYTRRPGQLSKAKAESQIASLKEIYKDILLRIGLVTTQQDLDLHYNIYAQKFADITIDQVINWFDKIIACNKNKRVFSKEKLIAEKDKVIKKMEAIKNRIFKIKIGQYNFCLNKQLKFYLEKRA